MKKIYHVHFHYFAHEQVRFVSHAVAADAPSMAVQRLLEHVRELHACTHCEGRLVADPNTFRHVTRRPFDRPDLPMVECLGTVGPLTKSDVRGHASVHFIVQDNPPAEAVTIKIGEDSWTYAQPGNADNPQVLR